MTTSRDPIIVEHDRGSNSLAVVIAVIAILVIIALVAVVAFMGGGLLIMNSDTNTNPNSPATSMPATNAPPAEPTSLPLATPQGFLSSAAFS